MSIQRDNQIWRPFKNDKLTVFPVSSGHKAASSQSQIRRTMYSVSAAHMTHNHEKDKRQNHGTILPEEHSESRSYKTASTTAFHGPSQARSFCSIEASSFQKPSINASMAVVLFIRTSRVVSVISGPSNRVSSSGNSRHSQMRTHWTIQNNTHPYLTLTHTTNNQTPAPAQPTLQQTQDTQTTQNNTKLQKTTKTNKNQHKVTLSYPKAH